MILNRVAVRRLPVGRHVPDGWRPGDPAHEHFTEAATHLRLLWSEIALQFAELVSTVYAVDLDSSRGVGYSSDHWITGPFTIGVTYFDPVGTAEGMVHELAHLKLLYLGVPREGKSVLLRNSPSERYPSPVRGCDRPMPAVLHALYSWVHMLHLDLRFMRIMQPYRESTVQRTGRNLTWVSEMLQTIDRHARWTRAGEAWYEGVRAWTGELMRQGSAIPGLSYRSPLATPDGP
jgi:HEXXH motif-containing protein